MSFSVRNTSSIGFASVAICAMTGGGSGARLHRTKAIKMRRAAGPGQASTIAGQRNEHEAAVQ